MTKLSVNINKLATLRNARGKNNPDVLEYAKIIESFGVHGITVHPRPDERHIRFSDVRKLSSVVRGEFNIEGYPDEAWLKLVEETAPHQATLVPDPPDAITSNAGFDVKASYVFLAGVCQRLARITKRPIRISVFIDPKVFSKDDAQTLREIGVHRIELYTESFADAFTAAQERGADILRDAELLKVIAVYRQAAEWAREAGLGINAGHDLTIENLKTLVREIPWIDEVSIGHALICDALEFGMREAVRLYLASLN